MEDEKFCLEKLSEDHFQLKRDHAYYYQVHAYFVYMPAHTAYVRFDNTQFLSRHVQVQAQLLCTKTPYCNLYYTLMKTFMWSVLRQIYHFWKRT